MKRWPQWPGAEILLDPGRFGWEKVTMATPDRARRGRSPRGARREPDQRSDRGERRERVVRELRRARPVPRTSLCRGTVVWAWISFPDEPAQHKTRPAVVSELLGHHVRVHPVTSSTKESVRRSNLYVLLEDWGAAGLSRPCLVDRRVVDLELGDITSVAGCLGAADLERVFATAGPTAPLL